MSKDNLKFGKNVLHKIIREYTREAGVRSLEREIAAICRKTARKIVQARTKTVSVTVRNLEMFLGAPRFRYGMAEKENEVGVATGVAWTETGGDILSIEATLMKGKGNLLLTGKLGEVMRESAQAGFSYIRTKAAELHVDEQFQEKYDVHIHIPEGAIPKDGPSAGITMATAVISALTGRAVRRDVAMTGEITLRGRILPVGGIKEKVLAAHRGGIKTMLLPVDNKKDLEEIPVNIQRKLRFVFVEHLDEVLPVALAPSEGEHDRADH